MTSLPTTRLTSTSTITSTRTRLTPDSLTDSLTITSLTITSLTPACPAARLTARLTPYGDDGMLAWEATLEAADDARVVTGDDGLDHYL